MIKMIFVFLYRQDIKHYCQVVKIAAMLFLFCYVNFLWKDLQSWGSAKDVHMMRLSLSWEKELEDVAKTEKSG